MRLHPLAHGPIPRGLTLPPLRLGNEHYVFYLVFGLFPAALGPETRSKRSGSKNGAERTQSYPRRPILKPFREHVLVRTHNPEPETVAVLWEGILNLLRVGNRSF